MMSRIWTVYGTLPLALVFCVGVGKCEKTGEESEEARDLCESLNTKYAVCAGAAAPSCDGPCAPACFDRWEAAREESEDCGVAYVTYYECLQDLSCEETDLWVSAVEQGTTEHPCGDMEVKFRSDCPAVPLHRSDE